MYFTCVIYILKENCHSAWPRAWLGWMDGRATRYGRRGKPMAVARMTCPSQRPKIARSTILARVFYANKQTHLNLHAYDQ